MPHMDKMGDMAGADYSDFEYQQIVTKQAIQGSGGSANARTTDKFAFEPLEGRGGLANNEVAELVALETIAHLESEDETADQTLSSFNELRGLVGANLSAEASAFPDDSTVSGDITPIEEQGIADQRIEARVLSEDAIFQQFQASLTSPFASSSTGQGGGGAGDAFHHFRNFRQISGRGPVLDQTDDLTVLARTIVGNSVAEVEGDVRLSCVWDVAETSDAGRAFSVPTDD